VAALWNAGVMSLPLLLAWTLLAFAWWLALIRIFPRLKVPWPWLNAALASWLLARAVLVASPAILHWIRALGIQ